MTDPRTAEHLERSIAQIIDERAMLSEQIKRIEQQINGLDRALTSWTFDMMRLPKTKRERIADYARHLMAGLGGDMRITESSPLWFWGVDGDANAADTESR